MTKFTCNDLLFVNAWNCCIKKKENTAKARYALKNKRSTTKIYNSRPYSVCHTWDNKKIFIHSQIISKKTVSHKRNSARLLCVRVRVYFISSFPLWLLCFRHTIHTAFVVIQLFHFVKLFFFCYSTVHWIIHKIVKLKAKVANWMNRKDYLQVLNILKNDGVWADWSNHNNRSFGYYTAHSTFHFVIYRKHHYLILNMDQRRNGRFYTKRYYFFLFVH